jgi:hypothetical protein
MAVSDTLNAYLTFEDFMMHLDDVGDPLADRLRDAILDPLWAELRDDERAALNARGDLRGVWPEPSLLGSTLSISVAADRWNVSSASAPSNLRASVIMTADSRNSTLSFGIAA